MSLVCLACTPQILTTVGIGPETAELSAQMLMGLALSLVPSGVYIVCAKYLLCCGEAGKSALTSMFGLLTFTTWYKLITMVTSLEPMMALGLAKAATETTMLLMILRSHTIRQAMGQLCSLKSTVLFARSLHIYNSAIPYVMAFWAEESGYNGMIIFAAWLGPASTVRVSHAPVLGELA